nr:hypothetical protein [Tanacetum cinerariifolium]
ESSTQAPLLLLVPITAILKTSIVPATTVPPTIQPFTSIPQQSTPTPKPTTKPSTTLIPVLLDFSSLFRFDHIVSTLEKELSRLKQKDRDDKDKDEDPSTGSDRGLKKIKTSKDAESTTRPNTKESKSSSSKGTKSQSKSSRKSVQAEEPEFEFANYVGPRITSLHRGSKQSSPVSSDFASKFLIMDNVPPVVDEAASMMNVNVRQEESSTQAPLLLLVPITAILKTSIVPATTVPLTIQPFTSIPQQSTPTPKPTTKPSTTLIPVLLDFSSLFRFDHIVSTLEKELS